MPSYHPEREIDIEDLASFIDDEPYYHLRRHAREKLSTLGMPWIDNDVTDTYDPREDSPRSKRKFTSERRGGQPSRPKRTRNLSPASPTALQERLEEQEKQKRDNEERRRQEEEEFLSSGPFNYNLRTRNKPSVTSEKAVDTADMNNTTGEPDSSHARHGRNSCLACQDLQIECSLIEDPFYYPCRDCQADNLECKLDPPPTWKRPCEGCKKRSKPCSYSSGDYDHGQPCHWCIQHGFDCIAGPARKRPPTGKYQRTNTKIVGELPVSNYIPVATDVTAEASGKSSPLDLDKWSQIEPESDAESVVSLQSKVSFITGSTTTPITTISEVPETASPRPNGRTSQLSTALQSSLTVWHEIPTDGSEPCNWCYNFAYGISGYGKLYPEVIDMTVDNYHGQRHAYTHGREPSRMCINCTIARVAILKCPHNKIENFFGAPLTRPEVRTAFDELYKASSALQPWSPHAGEAFPSPGYPWCSICREPSFHQCATPQAPTNRDWTFSQYLPSTPGCGLQLCDYCAHLVKLYRGDLDAVVKRGREDANNKTDFRADVTFILKRSPENVFKHLAGVE